MIPSEHRMRAAAAHLRLLPDVAEAEEVVGRKGIPPDGKIARSVRAEICSPIRNVD